jgi:two-component system cell cycle response regulator
MVYLLQYFGHDLLEARDGKEGVEAARREQPDLILMDVHMPGIDGYEAVREIGKHTSLRNIPLVAVTALAMVGDREKVLAGGFSGYIAKPINPETFVSQVEAFLGSEQPLSPRPVPAPASEPAGASHTKPAHQATILYVDNTALNLHLLCSILEPFGYQVIAVKTVAEALKTAQQMPVDLILSDVHMPNLDGYDFLKLVKADAQLRSIPFALISATLRAEEDRNTAMKLGAVKFISRPIEPRALLAQIEECLGSVRSV